MTETRLQQKWWAMALRQRGAERCLKKLEHNLDQEPIRLFQPTRLLLEYDRGTFQLRRRPLYPGYAFVQCATTLLQKIIENKPHGIYGLVRLGETFIPVQQHEMDMLHALIDDTGTVGLSHGELRGDRIRIISGPLKGKEGIICKFSKRKQRVTICLSLGNKRVMLDLACITQTMPTHSIYEH